MADVVDASLWTEFLQFWAAVRIGFSNHATFAMRNFLKEAVENVNVLFCNISPFRSA